MTASDTGNTNRFFTIIKNTAYLYIRTMLILFLSLFSTRIIISMLGDENFGIANVVSSVVALFYFFHSALTAMAQRYLSYEVGTGIPEKLNHTLRNTVILHWAIAFFLILILETLGLWFFTNKLNIPEPRKEAALYVFHASVMIAWLSIIQIPYQALIIAYEKMSVFAFISVVEATLKLTLLLSLRWFPGDKLILYSFIILATAMLVFLLYYITGRRLTDKKFGFKLEVDWKLFSEMLKFSSWYLLGGIAFLFMFQGGNILVNIFFGALANSAMGVAFQIHSSITAFSGNIRQAIEPRIVKNFATGDISAMTKTTFIGARYTFYLLLLFILPGLCDIDSLLAVWLKTVPPQSALFCRFIMIFLLIQNFDLSFSCIFKATGKIKENQIISGLIYLLTVPVAYIAFRLKSPLTIIFFIQIAAAFIVSFLVKFILMSYILKISTKYYFSDLLFPLFRTLLPCLMLVALFVIYVPAGVSRGVLLGVMLMFVLVFSCLYFDLDSRQRQLVLSKIASKLSFYKESDT